MESSSNYVGKKYIDDRDGRQDEHCDTNIYVLHSDLPKGTRIIHSDDMVTMDFRENRFNLHLDDNDEVTIQRWG